MASTQRESVDDDRASWPYGAMLGFGYFGAGTPAGRRHRNRSVTCLALMLLAAATAAVPALPWALRVLGAVALPLAWAGIVWSGIRYLAELDELSRLLQLEAAAVSYGIAIVLASVWFAVGALGVLEQPAAAAGTRPPSLLALLVLPSILLAEVLRGVALVVLARMRR